MSQPILNTGLFLYLLGDPGPFTDPDAGSLGGTQQIFQDRDPAAPDDPTLPAISFPTGGGTITQWDVTSQQWL